MTYIGIDIGGTNVKLALIEIGSGEPEIIERSVFPFAHRECGDLCKKIREHSEVMADKAGIAMDDVSGIGLSVPGSVDQTGEILLHAYNMGYHGVPVKKELQKYFPGKKIAMLNDANAAALAELYAGALKGCRNALLLTLGTGVGSGVIMDGRLFNGGQNRGCELGHLPFRNGGDPCTCGSTGCLEVYTSASRIAKKGGELMGPEFADARSVLNAARSGSETAQKIIDEYIEDLSSAIAGLCCAFDPEKIAIGGGFSAAGDVLYGPLNKLVEEKNFNRVPYEIVPARFLNDAGTIGAAYYVKLTQP